MVLFVLTSDAAKPHPRAKWIGSTALVGNGSDSFDSMAMRIRHDLDSDSCPVSDEMLGELYRASKNGLAELIGTVSPDLRAALAIYCYRRGHLKGIGLAVASTCNQHDLEFSGGKAGAALFAQSREASSTPPVLSFLRGVRKS